RLTLLLGELDEPQARARPLVVVEARLRLVPLARWEAGHDEQSAVRFELHGVVIFFAPEPDAEAVQLFGEEDRARFRVNEGDLKAARPAAPLNDRVVACEVDALLRALAQTRAKAARLRSVQLQRRHPAL